MAQPNLTFEQCAALDRKGASYVVYAAYAHEGHEIGDVLSWHKTHEAASRAAGQSQFRGVFDLNDVETEMGTYYYYNTKKRMGAA